MGVAFKSIAKTVVGSATDTLVCTHPSGLVVGDLMIASHLIANVTAPTIATPTGWASEIDQPGPTSSRPRTVVFSKIADSADVAAGSTTFIASAAVASAEDWKCAIIRLDGHDPSGAVNVSAGSSAISATMTCPSVSPTVHGTFVILTGGARNPRTGTGPAGFTERLDSGQDGDGSVGLLVYTKNVGVVEGATGTFDITLSSLDDHSRVTLAIAPLSPVTFHGFTKAVTNFSDAKPQTLVLAVPPGTVLNNLLVAVISEAVDRPTRTIPSGWALVDRSIGFQPMDVEGNDGAQRQAMLSVFFKVASASEPADYTWSWSNAFGTGRFGYMLRFSGQDLDRPFDDAQSEGGTVAVQVSKTGFVYRSNAPTAPGSFVIRFGMGFTVSTAAGGAIVGPTGDILLDSDVSSESSNGIQVWIGTAAENPLSGRGPFPKSFLVPNEFAKYCVGTLTIAAARTPGVGLRVETATRRVQHVQETDSPRFVDFSDDMVIPPTDLGDLLLSFGYFNPALGNPQSVTIPVGWTSVRITPLTQSRGVASVDRRIVGGSEPLFYTWLHGASALRRFQNITLAIKGFNSSNPINVEGIFDNLIGANIGTTVTSPSVVTTVDGCLILRYFVSDNGLSSDPGLPAGITSIGQESVIIGTKWKVQVVVEGIQAVAGATGTADWTGVFVGSGSAAGTIAIEPFAGVPPGGGPIGGPKGPFRLLGRRWRELGTGA